MFICISNDINCTSVNSYNRAKQRYLERKDGQLHPVEHLISAAEAGALVRTSTFTFSEMIDLSFLKKNRCSI
jgi:hypothetical protein